MSQRIRYIAAAAAAVLAGLLTLLYLGGRSAASGTETEIIWVTAEPIAVGAQLHESQLQRVRVDGPTRQLLASETLPASTPVEGWYASVPIDPGQPLIPGRNLATEPAAALPDGTVPADLRIVMLETELLPPGFPQVGEEVDIYVVPAQGGAAVRILMQTRVVMAEGDLIGLLIPDSQVGNVLTATDGLPVKVVRRVPAR